MLNAIILCYTFSNKIKVHVKLYWSDNNKIENRLIRKLTVNNEFKPQTTSFKVLVGAQPETGNVFSKIEEIYLNKIITTSKKTV